jgi:hypothetical protein
MTNKDFFFQICSFLENMHCFIKRESNLPFYQSTALLDPQLQIEGQPGRSVEQEQPPSREQGLEPSPRRALELSSRRGGGRGTRR